MRASDHPTRPEVLRHVLSRRVVLIAAGGALASGGLFIQGASAATKMAQKAVSYQDTPKGRARCDNCAQWQPPSSCKLVTGTINPAGWCTVYAPKS